VTLEEALRVSQSKGRELLSAQEQYILSAISLLSERHLWGPRFFNDTGLTLNGSGDDGNFTHALDIINTLRVTKRLPSGGEVEARWVWDATEQLRETAGGRYTQASSIVLAGNVPLLRGAGTIARESLIQAERDLVYQARSFERFRRTYLVSIAQDYFGLLQTRASIVNQERQLRSLQEFGRATRARVDAGRLQAFETAITDNRIASAQSALASLRESYTLALDRFKVRLGLPIEEAIDVSEALPTIPEPDILDLDRVATTALEYRLDLQNARDQVDDSRRAVRNADNNRLPDLDLNASVTVPTDPDDRQGGVSFSPNDTSYRVGANLSLPLDRRIETLSLRASQVRLARAERDYTQRRDEIVVSTRSAARNVELTRFRLNLAEQQVEINKRRLRAQKLQEDAVSPQTIVDTENELLQAENDRDAARADLRSAILQYLLESDQLRVKRDGTLDPLPGMEIAPTP
jgi:outer membrane protein TolC